MKKIVICALAGLALVAAASPSLAAGHGLYTGVGTLGYNLGYKFSVTKSLGLRVGVNTFKYSDKIKQGDVEYKGDLKLNSVELTADWHPFGNGFALTGGVLVNDNKFTGDARPTLPGQLKVGDRVFSGADPRAQSGRKARRRCHALRWTRLYAEPRCSQGPTFQCRAWCGHAGSGSQANRIGCQ